MSNARLIRSAYGSAEWLTKTTARQLGEVVVCLFLLIGSLAILLPATSGIASLKLNSSIQSVYHFASAEKSNLPTKSNGLIAAEEVEVLDAEEPAGPEHLGTNCIVAALILSAALFSALRCVKAALAGLPWHVFQGPAPRPSDRFPRINARPPPFFAGAL